MSNEKFKRARPFCLHMRLNASEKERLEKESRAIGKTRSEAMREVYFGSSPRSVLISAPQFEKIISELKRIGNNINQLAHKANIGDIVLDKYFASVQEELHQILIFIRRTSGLR